MFDNPTLSNSLRGKKLGKQADNWVSLLTITLENEAMDIITEKKPGGSDEELAALF